MESNWNIIFRTGHEFLAGTDANIFIQLTDRNFDRSPIIKFNGGQGGVFEAKAKDKFSFQLSSTFQTVSKISIWHDGKGKASGWKLESVGLQLEENDRVFFEIQQVLYENEIIERSASPTEKLVDYTLTLQGSDTKLKVVIPPLKIKV